ncbi:hypothetical protein HAX54_020886 [Datura stramonium]|uniref:Uncharacterized protein n=1 Tax=Datura stramonium TaxID=4076 RepID=A0ABS8UTR2_DATST|nr:hypothetical protein [Datura stramonium]
MKGRRERLGGFHGETGEGKERVGGDRCWLRRSDGRATASTQQLVVEKWRRRSFRVGEDGGLGKRRCIAGLSCFSRSGGHGERVLVGRGRSRWLPRAGWRKMRGSDNEGEEKAERRKRKKRDGCNFPVVRVVFSCQEGPTKMVEGEGKGEGGRQRTGRRS